MQQESARSQEAWDDAQQLVQEIADRLSTYDWENAEQRCLDLVARINETGVPFPERDGKALLTYLRKKRQFQLMERVGDALIRGEQNSPQIRRQYAQALIEQGNMTAAELVLQSLASDPAVATGERAEARGLLGRIFKQLFVSSREKGSVRRQQNLKKAISFYGGIYQTSGELWHGINLVALAARAERDGILLDEPIDVRGESTKILSVVTSKPQLDSWDEAICAESCLALSQWQDAAGHLIYFIKDQAVDAFEVGSFYRQLTEVWELEPGREPGASLLPLLRAALASRGGERLELAPAVVKDGLEKVFGSDRYQPYAWLKTGLERCAAVARIEDRFGRRLGTGFLLDAKAFLSEGPSAPVLLTNRHVISPADDIYPDSIPPQAAQANFEVHGQTFPVRDVLWTSKVNELDATFVSLAELPAGTAPCPLEPAGAPFDNSGRQRLYVIGYPLGGALSVSLLDSVWLDTDGTFMHYRTPTEPGSSGSPVFDQKYWSLVGLHHKGKRNMPRLNKKPGTYDANEAISIEAIRAAVRGDGRWLHV